MTKKRWRQVSKKSGTPSLRCFVAMRIGDPDADAVYERLIEPAIRRVGLTPRRIDRVMHNERIDQKILAELQGADVVVADLTFARPSVYWEAGFAEARPVPVVYTCRRDHLRPRPEDEYGNFKVHFDLQTKNIIPWTKEGGRKFAEALKARLWHVLRPILRERNRASQVKGEEERFSALSLATRRQCIIGAGIHQARGMGFRGDQYRAGLRDYPRLGRRWVSLAEYAAKLHYDGPDAVHTAWLFALHRVTKSSLGGIAGPVMLGPVDEEPAEAAKAKHKALIGHVVVVCLRPIPPSLVEETLPQFQRDQRLQSPAWFLQRADWGTSAGRPRGQMLVIHAVGGVRSERQAREALRQILSSIKSYPK